MKCEVCFKDFNYLGRHLWNRGKPTHDITTKEYYIKYILKSKSEPICLNCKGFVSFHSISTGFNKFCSVKCASLFNSKNELIKIKRKKSCKKTWSRKKYKKIASENGKKSYSRLTRQKDDYANSDDELVEKWIKKNILNNKNHLNPGKSQIRYFKKNYPFILNQILNRTKFLDNNVNFSERLYCIVYGLYEIPKCKECLGNNKFITFNKGYQDFCCLKCVHKSDEISNKIKQTNLKRYGVSVPILSKKIKRKIRNTCIKKYGVENPFKSAEIQSKIRKTNLEKLPENINNSKWLKYQHYDMKKSCSQIAKEQGVSHSLIVKRLEKFKIKAKYYGFSIMELEVLEFIKNLPIRLDIESNKRYKKYELDIIIDNKFGIEFDGLFWHSYDKEESSKEKKYHLDKSIFFKEKNIDLFHIFENEWIDLNKQDIWKSIISGKLGINNRIYARKCKINKISNQEYKLFLNNNHLQGHIGSKIKLGLYYNEELVSVMSFSKPRFNNNYEYELLRYCCKKYNNIIGGPSKLLHFFIKKYNPNSIISYADLRYSNGNMYKKLNMNHKNNSNPNYYYFLNNNKFILESRLKFQKHKLHKLLDNFDSSLTESQNMFNHGYRRIWDCGNMVFEWKK